MNCRLIAFVLTVGISLGQSALAQMAPATTPSSSITVIRAGNLIDPRSGETKRNQAIVVRGNRVESVGDAGSAAMPPGAKVIDLSNATVLPGMIESHTHIFLQGEDPALGGYDIQLLKFPLAYRAAR